MAAPTTGRVILGGQDWSLQRKARVKIPYPSPARPTSALMQKELDSLVFRRGGIIYEAKRPMEREGWLSASPSPHNRQARRKGSIGESTYFGSAGYTSTVPVQTGALDRSTGLSTPNWFAMVGPHLDDYGAEYYASRNPPRPETVGGDAEATGRRPQAPPLHGLTPPSSASPDRSPPLRGLTPPSRTVLGTDSRSFTSPSARQVFVHAPVTPPSRGLEFRPIIKSPPAPPTAIVSTSPASRPITPSTVISKYRKPKFVGSPNHETMPQSAWAWSEPGGSYGANYAANCEGSTH